MTGVTFRMVGACVRWLFLFRRKSFDEVLEEHNANYWTGLILFMTMALTSVYLFETTPHAAYAR
jgi:hypothetical protein